MAKRDHLSEAAERLYVIEGKSFTSIAKELRTSDKSIRSWKAKAKTQGNDWEIKRQQYLKSRQTFHEDLYEFGREIMDNLRDTLKAGKEVPMAQASLFRTVVGSVTKVKDYEDVALAETDTKKPEGITPDMARKIKKEIFGVE